MAEFFFYGTLCHPPLLAEVLGRETGLRPARLAGFASHWVEGHAFPMIAPADDGVAEGVLATGISEEEAARLDYYEGGFAYSVREVAIGAGGEAVSARVYFPDTSRLRPGAAWDLARWQAELGEAAVLAARGSCRASAGSRRRRRCAATPRFWPGRWLRSGRGRRRRRRCAGGRRRAMSR